MRVLGTTASVPIKLLALWTFVATAGGDHFGTYDPAGGCRSSHARMESIAALSPRCPYLCTDRDEYPVALSTQPRCHRRAHYIDFERTSKSPRQAGIAGTRDRRRLSAWRIAV